ncbi:MAG: LON peptidase substrate-binding domain-containing protein, partial [Deltaproteobacteria bacterium]|nr:LON peptidase substrate-binding domain-containing protein [Deltaproteobacteria bacterium]
MEESDKDTAALVDDRPVSEIPDIIPLLPIRDIVIYPYMMIPLFIGRELSINAVNEALERDRHIFLVVQKDAAEDDPATDDLYRVGTVATILRMLKLDDGRVKILVQGMTKGILQEFVREEPYFETRIEKVIEPQVIEVSIEVEALMRNVKEKIEQ